VNLVVDPDTVELGRILHQGDYEAACERVNAELKLKLETEVPFPNSRTEYSPVEATPLLNEHRKRIEQHAVRLANAYGPIQWLWYLRRLPPYIFGGRLATTLPYNSALADLITALAPARGAAFEHERRVRYPLDVRTAPTLYGFCATVRYLSQVHAALRWAGKGAFFRRDEAAYLPLDWAPDADLERDVEWYDQRVELGSRIFSHWGTLISDVDIEHEVPVPIVARMDPRVIEAPLSLDARSRTPLELGSVEAQFAVKALYLSRLASIDADPRVVDTKWRQPWLGGLLALMSGALVFALQTRGRVFGLFERGYIIDTKSEISSALQATLLVFKRIVVGNHWPALQVPASPGQLLSQIGAIPIILHPLSAPPVVRREGRLLCVDLASATKAVQKSINLDGPGGELVNARGAHFESAVQDILDASRWKPSEPIRALRGRTLTVGGAPLTDIDAVGQLGDELLLVSCKSRVYSEEYDAGSYRIVRNRASDIEDSVRAWDARIAALKGNPRGDNYDFSKYRVFGVVCTATPVFVRDGVATRLVERDLPAACSIRELEQWAGGSLLTEL
jgi:hypothetical protein